VNTSFAVFDKTGKVLLGPAATRTLWSGFGGGCQANNDGDATVVYDRQADHWIISQFSVSTTRSSIASRGGSTTYAIAVNPVNGFGGSVSLSVTGLPARAAGTFSPNQTTTTSTLTVTTQRNVARGTRTLTIRGTSGALAQTATVTLTIN
jgi:hypothetical protein